MNLVLFEAHELEAPLPRTDARARHVLEVLRRDVGDSFDAGIVNGPLGKAFVRSIGEHALELTFEPSHDAPPAAPVILVVGMVRPQTARDILRDATSLGVSAMHFVMSERADPNYARSRLWTDGEWRRHLLTGAAQAFDTRIPSVTIGRPLAEALDDCPAMTDDARRAALCRVALDPYEATMSLGQWRQKAGQRLPGLCMAIGPERGWGQTDRDVLRARGFCLARLGSRILRTETAVIAALSVAGHFGDP